MTGKVIPYLFLKLLVLRLYKQAFSKIAFINSDKAVLVPALWIVLLINVMLYPLVISIQC